jgi:hypothetical protein
MIEFYFPLQGGLIKNNSNSGEKITVVYLGDGTTRIHYKYPFFPIPSEE